MSDITITQDKTPWYQWDTGLTVTVSGGEMTECHFANRKQGTAYVQAVIKGKAKVPDELLQVAALITAYGYIPDGAGGQTYIEQVFEVIARNIPADYTYTKTAQKIIRDAEQARDQAFAAVDHVHDVADEVVNFKVDAETSAKAAKTSADSAEYQNGQAKQYADNAGNAMANAQGFATQASANATAAEWAKNHAKTSETNAAASASEAATSAQEAKTAAGSAAAAAKSAQDAAASADAINIIAPKKVDIGASAAIGIAIGARSVSEADGIAFGEDAKSLASGVIVIGPYTSVDVPYCVGIGGANRFENPQSVALGRDAYSTRAYEVSVGNPTKGTRYIAGVKDPELLSDAATKNYVDNLVTSANMVRGSNSITVADGTAKVNPAIFGDGLSVTDGQVSVDLDHVGEHLAGDALYYDQTDGLMLKVGQGLHIQNDELDIDQANLPLASEGVRGTVRVGSGLTIDADGVLSATGGGGVGGYGKIAKATLKTTERVSGIAGGEDDVVVDADVPCAVGEMDGTLFLTSAPAYRVLRTTYTTGTVLHLEFEWSVDGAQLDPSMLTHAVLSLGNASTLVPVTTRSVDGKRYKVVEYTATSDIKAGMSVSLKFI